ncbi:transporter substrate-binding domain-containing protein [Roseovarius sp. C7]|uniref:transporter substrate-binding domain-containing protein n=1 Tax=Roseovarius sp. C7 TaxID=3398643 RepID=UPI0039F712D3
MFRTILLLALLLAPLPVIAQDTDPLRIGTVTRSPFSMPGDDGPTGFSIDLWEGLAERMAQSYEFVRFDDFSEMLQATEEGRVDAAIANISITAERERTLDFSQPIFSAGLQVMIPDDGTGGTSIWKILLSKDILLAIGLAFGLLLGGGMLMWRLERGRQPYFDLSPREALFPAFWWALNLVVNGGFEERMPRSPAGRLFGVILVISSLFIVSVFVAKITSVMTVEAINTSISGLNDLYGKRVGTVQRSTAADYLDRRELKYTNYANPQDMLADFEAGTLDAVVYDAPILAYYAVEQGRGSTRLAGPVFLRENYGIALPPGSDLAEEINQALLNMREDGSYNVIYRDWFGDAAK